MTIRTVSDPDGTGHTSEQSKRFLYALALETLEFSLIPFAIGLTVEILFPGLFNGRIPVGGLIAIFLVILVMTVLTGRAIGAPFPFMPSRKDPLTWIGIIWIAFLLTMVSARFSPYVAPILIFVFFTVAQRLFRRIRERASR